MSRETKERPSIKPCDCKDMEDAMSMQEQGIKWNEDGIVVEPNVVILTMGSTTIRIPMSRFKMFAEWYLQPQMIKRNKKR